MDLGSVREVSCLESGGGESGRRKCLINQSRITRAPFRERCVLHDKETRKGKAGLIKMPQTCPGPGHLEGRLRKH